eukprot:1572385-Alexandrium_andersonii.AAC.1
MGFAQERDRCRPELAPETEPSLPDASRALPRPAALPSPAASARRHGGEGCRARPPRLASSWGAPRRAPPPVSALAEGSSA